jgi:hypothetical protein
MIEEWPRLQLWYEFRGASGFDLRARYNFGPNMSSELKNTIEGLASAEAKERSRAATEIYRVGKEAAEKAVKEWWSDAELAGLLLGEVREVTVGIAVGRDTFGRIRAANGVSRLAEVPSEQDAEEFELHFGKSIAFDILTSRAPGGDGAIAKYLAKFGEGVQQVEFRCLDVDRATEILKERFGVKPVYGETRAGADGTRVNFFLVSGKDGKKVLVELFEKRVES